jgi:hypothetical protein
MEQSIYKNMDQEDLENLNVYLTSLLAEREKQVIEAIKERDENKLQYALKDNKKLTLPPKAWKAVSFKEMSKKDLNFFFYIRTLPEYRHYDQSIHLSQLSLTEKALIEGVYKKDLFDVFINHSELSNRFKNIIEWAAISDEVPVDIVQELLGKEIIKITDEFREEVINCGYDNYINYFLNSEKYKLNAEEYRTVYLNNWNTIFDNPILEKVKEQFPQYKDISIVDILESLDIDGNRPLEAKYRKLISLNDELLFYVLKTHPFDAQSIFYMLELFDERPVHFNNKFIKFINLIIEELPQHIQSLKEGKHLVCSKEIKPTFEKLLNVAELKGELNENGITPKKLKL